MALTSRNLTAQSGPGLAANSSDDRTGIVLPEPRPVRPVRERFYRPELDCLRFAAFMMVFFSHAIELTPQAPYIVKVAKASGMLGVPIFFMLSAYLITELLMRENSVTGSLNIRAFYIRRILRIWPAYYVVLAGGFLLFNGFVPGFVGPSALWSYALFCGNWFSTRHGFLPPLLGPLWSISVEEQFYLVWPIIILWAGRRAFWIVCATAWFLSQFAVFALCQMHSWTGGIWMNSLTHLQYFALGAGVSLALNGSNQRLSLRSQLGLIAIGVAALLAANSAFDTTFGMSVGGFDTSLRRTYPGYLITGVGAASILIAVLGGTLRRGFKPFVWLAKRAYGLYIYHLPCQMISIALCAALLHTSIDSTTIPEWTFLFRVGLGLPLTVAVAAISYRYLESPFLRLKARFEIVKPRAA